MFVYTRLYVHGDEALPYDFLAGAEGIPGWNPERQQQLGLFKQALAKTNPDNRSIRVIRQTLPAMLI